MVRLPAIVVRSSSTMLKDILLRNRGGYQSQILCEPPWVGVKKFFKRHLGHMTKMAATAIYGKNCSKIFSGTGGPISTKLGMNHRGLLLIIVCSNDDPGLTLT